MQRDGLLPMAARLREGMIEHVARLMLLPSTQAMHCGTLDAAALHAGHALWPGACAGGPHGLKRTCCVVSSSSRAAGPPSAAPAAAHLEQLLQHSRVIQHDGAPDRTEHVAQRGAVVQVLRLLQARVEPAVSHQNKGREGVDSGESGACEHTRQEQAVRRYALTHACTQAHTCADTPTLISPHPPPTHPPITNTCAHSP